MLPEWFGNDGSDLPRLQGDEFDWLVSRLTLGSFLVPLQTCFKSQLCLFLPDDLVPICRMEVVLMGPQRRGG